MEYTYYNKNIIPYLNKEIVEASIYSFIKEDLNILDALITCGGAKSKREAREFVNGGSILINGERIKDVEFIVSKANAFGSEATVIRRGKKNYFVIKHV